MLCGEYPLVSDGKDIAAQCANTTGRNSSGALVEFSAVYVIDVKCLEAVVRQLLNWENIRE